MEYTLCLVCFLSTHTNISKQISQSHLCTHTHTLDLELLLEVRVGGWVCSSENPPSKHMAVGSTPCTEKKNPQTWQRWFFGLVAASWWQLSLSWGDLCPANSVLPVSLCLRTSVESSKVLGVSEPEEEIPGPLFHFY